MKNPDVIIVGAGAAGLMAAYTLSKAGKTVTVLEARNRLGGRIHTVNNTDFSAVTELGAEFVHGNLPLSLKLLKEAGISTTPVNFEMWHYSKGNFKQNSSFVEHWEELLKKANALQNDMPLKAFLEMHFADDKYAKMRMQTEDYVSGYDTANINDVSVFALRNEWNHEDEDAQHRINGGYLSLINYLANICLKAGSSIQLEAAVKEITWQENNVKVIAANGTVYQAPKVIVALPLGILKADENTPVAIQFNPPIPKHHEAIQNMGFGSVIKILLEFDEILWENDAIEANLATMGFLFTEEKISTFWTQSPTRSALLTGWIGGIPALALRDTADDVILDIALKSVANVFNIPANKLRNKLVTHNIANWSADPFTRGSYAYDTVASPAARQVLQQPVANSLFFTGEYLYDGPAMGTVEAALVSGKNIAEKAML